MSASLTTNALQERFARVTMAALVVVSLVGVMGTLPLALAGALPLALPAVLTAQSLVMGGCAWRMALGETGWRRLVLGWWMVVSGASVLLSSPVAIPVASTVISIGILAAALLDRERMMAWVLAAVVAWLVVTVTAAPAMPWSAFDMAITAVFPSVYAVVLGGVLARLVGQLFEALEEGARRRQIAEEANAARSRFLTNMSHELRTPLNAIIGYAELLGEETEGAAAADADRIVVAGRHLLSLVNDVLDMSRIESDALRLRSVDFDLEEELAGLHDLVTPLAAQRGNALNWSVGEGLPRPAHGDAGRVRQVLLNLLGNACKFTDHGAISLRVERATDQVTFEVSDTGSGIASEMLPHLFEPFVQGEAAGLRHEGTGLGLAITRHLVEAMNGTIAVESVVGQGTRFRVCLPLAPA